MTGGWDGSPKVWLNNGAAIFDESHQELKSKEVGEIAIKSKSIAKGYLKNNKLWNEKIYGDYFLTGDYGYLNADGYLFVVSRRSDLILSGGENIDPVEIENILLKYRSINEAKVFPIADKKWGQVPASVVVCKESEICSGDEILQYLRENLSAFKIPKKILIIDKMPKTHLGKIDINSLKSMIDRN